jgi:hypothetical protein
MSETMTMSDFKNMSVLCDDQNQFLFCTETAWKTTPKKIILSKNVSPKNSANYLAYDQANRVIGDYPAEMADALRRTQTAFIGHFDQTGLQVKSVIQLGMIALRWRL